MRGPAPHGPAPERREGAGEALGHPREAVAVAGGLAGEQDRPAGRQDALELGECPGQVGDVMEDRVAEDEVEALIGERQVLGVGGLGRDFEPEARRRSACSVASIPGEMSLQVASADQRRPPAGSA